MIGRYQNGVNVVKSGKREVGSGKKRMNKYEMLSVEF